LNRFWPRRPSPEGFSVEKLANRCKQKSSINSFRTAKALDNQMKFKNQVKNLIPQSSSSNHWANRDFIEYLDVA
tara:strand:- start:55 stop:276 length:222 start_codon:yes stop_codon:yes gene_type:complete